MPFSSQGQLAKAFWDMASIFSGLFPNMYGGIPFQWISKRRDAWHEASRLILKGKHMCDSAGSHGEEDCTQKCSPHLSITTPLLVLLLWRWSSNVKSAGGVVSAEHRDAAHTMVDVLVSIATHKVEEN